MEQDQTVCSRCYTPAPPGARFSLCCGAATAPRRLLGAKRLPPVLVVIGVVIAALYGLGMLVAQTKSPTSSAAQAASAPSDNEATTATIGGLAYSVLDVRQTRVLGESYSRERAAGEFVVVRLSVENVGGRAARISSQDFHLVRGGTRYDASPTAVHGDEDFFLTTVNPGVTRAGTVAFDVPADTSPSSYRLEVYGNAGGDSTTLYLPY